MYAVIQTGGKQYKVTEGMEIAVEKLAVEEQKTVTLDKVLLIVDGETLTIGNPYVTGKSVSAKVLKQGRDNKIYIVKFKSKTGYRKKNGHRQPYTLLKIEKIGSSKTSSAQTTSIEEKSQPAIEIEDKNEIKSKTIKTEAKKTVVKKSPAKKSIKK